MFLKRVLYLKLIYTYNTQKIRNKIKIITKQNNYYDISIYLIKKKLKNFVFFDVQSTHTNKS